MAIRSKATDIYQKALVQTIRAHGLPQRTKASQEWFAQQAKSIEFLNKKEFLRDQNNRPAVTPRGIEPGSMYTFNYDAKWKEELPVWDRYPLIFPFNIQGKYIYGLNMHYLPHALRAQLMDALTGVATDTKYTQNTKLKISWKIIKEVAKSELYEPTVHCYIKSHIKSRVKFINPQEWVFTLYLPLAVGAGTDKDAIAEFMSFQ